MSNSAIGSRVMIHFLRTTAKAKCHNVLAVVVERMNVGIRALARLDIVQSAILHKVPLEHAARRVTGGIHQNVRMQNSITVDTMNASWSTLSRVLLITQLLPSALMKVECAIAMAGHIMPQGTRVVVQVVEQKIPFRMPCHLDTKSKKFLAPSSATQETWVVTHADFITSHAGASPRLDDSRLHDHR